MRRLLATGFLCILVGVVFLYQDEIINVYDKIKAKFDKSTVLESKNAYYRNYDFSFVQNTDNFSPQNRQDLYNIYYTILNSGNTNFSFYCPNNYKDCLSEVRKIANDQSLLSYINNFVHPFNSFKNIETQYNSYGKVTVKIEHAYTKGEIKLINDKINAIDRMLSIDNNLSDVEKIKIYHDYIVANSKYDSDRSDKNIIKYKSDIAYGPLFEGYAICGGYTDLMALFLEKLQIKNYRVSSDNHVWNGLYLNGNWLNLDLTWDDPITSDGTDVIEYKFFLINTAKLYELEKTQHIFDTNIYKELV